MTTRLVLDVVGLRVEVVADQGRSECVAAARSVLGPVAGGPDGPAHCSVNVRSGDLESLLGAAARAAIQHSPRLLLHAAAVTCAGGAVLLPGTSGTGKSTMAAACVLRGLGYLTDEMVAVDTDTGAVEGWPRPLMLTPWSMRAVGLDAPGGTAKQAVPCDVLGGFPVAGPLPVAHVVALRHGASTAIEPMPAGEILRHVLDASFNHYRYGAAAWEMAAQIARHARGWLLDVAEPGSAAGIIARLTA